MTDDTLTHLFTHNNWANHHLITTCTALTDDELDAAPQSATKGSIRNTLLHLVAAQRGYLALLTEPVTTRQRPPLAFGELAEVAQTSGEGLLALARGERDFFAERLQTSDAYWVAPWVVMVQAINHATEHREQISSMLSALGVTPPDLDGWTYGDATGALVPMSD